MTSFNPVLTIGRQLAEPLETHQGMTTHQADERQPRCCAWWESPMPKTPQRLPSPVFRRNAPAGHDCHGPLLQPSVLIADEPTTALDVTIQSQITELVSACVSSSGMSIIWITHDLGVIASLADRVNVMYAGYIIEEAAVFELYEAAQHPYTLALMAALPRVDERRHERLKSIPGAPPNLLVEPHGCPFAARCEFALDVCRERRPELLPVSPGHMVACWVDISTGKQK